MKKPGTHAHALAYGRAIKMATISRGITESGLAKQIGYSAPYVCRILRAKQTPSARFLAMTCAALGMSREWLDALAGQAPPTPAVCSYLAGKLAA